MSEHAPQVHYLQIEGERGEPGKSAYEVAREAGYRGTRSQWLQSLKGPAGESVKGDPGPPGEPGPPGQNAVLVPALALFDRDQFDRTSQVTLIERDSGKTLATIRPIRNEITGLMEAAEIVPA
jgi:hypothetical protein